MIVTVDEIKTYLYGTTVPASYDTLFTQLINEVEAEIKSYTGVVIGNDTEYVSISNEVGDGANVPVIRTRYKPVRTLTKIEVKDTDFNWVENTDQDLSNIDIDGSVIHTKSVYARGVMNLKFSYTAGYLTTEVPEDLKRCAIMMVISAFNKRESIGYNSQDVLDLSLAISNTTPIEIANILEEYRGNYLEKNRIRVENAAATY